MYVCVHKWNLGICTKLHYKHVCLWFKLFASGWSARPTPPSLHKISLTPLYVELSAATKLSEAEAGATERLRVSLELRLQLISPQKLGSHNCTQMKLRRICLTPNLLTQFVGDSNSFLCFALCNYFELVSYVRQTLNAMLDIKLSLSCCCCCYFIRFLCFWLWQ